VVTATPAAIQAAVHAFLHPRLPQAAAPPARHRRAGHRRRPAPKQPLPAGMTAEGTAYRSAFAGAAARAHLPGLYPTLVPSASTWQPQSWAADPRTYRASPGAGPADAVYAYWQVSLGGFWGLEQTRFTAAPVLDGADATGRIGGRRVRLFYDGAHLHRIAWLAHGTAYWVTNTLLDELTNAQMRAIVRGLRPLR
jgi:hypothetical protein